jgi:hypothetical protein
MPSISQSQNADLSGYEPVETPMTPALPALIKNTPNSDVFNRCPLPPFNIDPDTLRQFENTGSGVPQMRVIPLPQQSGGSVTNINNGATTSSSSSGGGGSTNTNLAVKSASFLTGTIAANGWQLGTISLSESFQLISISANSACNVRLYGTSNSQSFDAPRAVDAPVPAEITQGLITDIVFDTSPFSWGFQNAIGANQNSVASPLIYITVLNTQAGSVTGISVTISYIPLET